MTPEREKQLRTASAYMAELVDALIAVEKERDVYRQRSDDQERELNEQDRRIAQLTATVRNKDDEIADLTFRLGAVNTAVDSMQQAAANVRSMTEAQRPTQRLAPTVADRLHREMDTRSSRLNLRPAAPADEASSGGS